MTKTKEVQFKKQYKQKHSFDSVGGTMCLRKLVHGDAKTHIITGATGFLVFLSYAIIIV